MTNPAPLRHRTMRERNLAVLLGQVAAHQPVTRARLAELTGLTKTTVSNLVTVLSDRGLVADGNLVHEGERGRPGVAVSVDPGGAAGLGLEINVDYLAACVVDLGRRVRYRHVAAADNRDRSPAAVIESLAALARQALSSAAAQGLPVAGAAAGLPGVLSDGVLLRAPNLGWRDVPVAALLAEWLPPLRLPVLLDNEANLAALGELWFGAGPGLGDFVHVSGEIGIGAGLVVGGTVFRGAHGFAGELGHVTVAPGGPPCTCGGSGCLEQVAGQEAILRAAGLTSVTATTGVRPDGSVTALLARLDAGDKAALDAVAEAGSALGTALTAVVNLLDPEAVVLGGVYTPLAPWIRPAVETSLTAGSGVLRTLPCPVVVSGLAGEAAVLGAAGAVVETLIADPARLL